MSQEISPATGKPYGTKRVCATCQYPRSTLYNQQQRAAQPEPSGAKRGPKPALSDAELPALVRADLEASPFSGEGHRKVWARLKYGKGIAVSRKRILRIMREHHLLSPHRQPHAQTNEHKGTIMTQGPNEMWGVDGSRVFTADDGYVWIFTAMEHWNAECMGFHVTKKGDRFAALEPVAQGVLAQFGEVGKDAARGLALRMDHGSQYLSEHFQNQVKFWGIAPSFAFLEQPQTNGVAERFFRTLKEQAIYGRTFRTLGEVRQAVTEFVARYNQEWRVEKNGFLSPRQMRDRVTRKEAA